MTNTKKTNSPFLTLLLSAASMGAVACAPGSSAGGDGDAPVGSRSDSLSCPPPDLFEAALCVCDDFQSTGQLDITAGPSGAGHVGVNGETRFNHTANIASDFRSFSNFSNVGQITIAGSLSTAGSVDALGEMHVSEELSAGGDLVSVGQLQVDGALRVRGEESIAGIPEIGSRAEYQDVTVPCGCAGDDFFDVVAAVDAARQDNDNDAIDLETQLAAVGNNTLDLSAGTYYLSEASMVGISQISISGSVSLFVDTSIDLVGAETISLETGATLDLFVAGNLATVGNLSVGSEADPQALRIYVGGQDSIAVSVGEQDFFGSIYAPQAVVEYVGDTRIVGSLFAKSLDGVGALEIAYGSPTQLDPNSCLPPVAEEDPEMPQDEPEGPQID